MNYLLNIELKLRKKEPTEEEITHLDIRRTYPNNRLVVKARYFYLFGYVLGVILRYD